MPKRVHVSCPRSHHKLGSKRRAKENGHTLGGSQGTWSLSWPCPSLATSFDSASAQPIRTTQYVFLQGGGGGTGGGTEEEKEGQKRRGRMRRRGRSGRRRRWREQQEEEEERGEKEGDREG